MNSILIFILNLREIAGGRRVSPDRGYPLVFREGWAIGDGRHRETSTQLGLGQFT